MPTRSVLVPAVFAALATAACAPPAPVAGDHATEVAACAAAVAAHVGKPVEAVTAAWTGASAAGTGAGTGVVIVSDAAGSGGERVHTCEVDASGRVRAILHPGA